MSLAAGGLAVFAWHSPFDPNIVRLTGVGLLGLGLGLIGLDYAQSPVTVLDSRGLRDRFGRIHWRDVRRVWVESVATGSYLYLEVPRKRYPSRLPPRDDGYDPRETVIWDVDSSVMDTSREDLKTALRTWVGPTISVT